MLRAVASGFVAIIFLAVGFPTQEIRAAQTVPAEPPAGSNGPKFTAAVVRPDGALVPFAAYDSGQWKRVWPQADEEIDATLTTDTVPSRWSERGEHVPTLWRVWRSGDEPAIETRVAGTEIVEAQCSSQIALKTNLPNRLATDPYTYGVAVDSASVRAHPIALLTHGDARWSAAERTIGAALSRLEREAASGQRERRPVERPTPRARVSALYAEDGTGPSPMYFVAEKRYRTPRFSEDPHCEAVTIMTGWLTPTPSRTYVIRESTLFLSDCDSKEVRSGVPLAAFHVSGRTWWVLREHGYEDEVYRLVEVGKSEIHYVPAIDMGGGGC